MSAGRLSEIQARAEVLAMLAETKPRWQREDAPLQVRIADRRYWLIDEVDAGRLEALRQAVLALVSSGDTSRADSR